MEKEGNLQTWSSKKAIAILAVDNIKVSDFGYQVLKEYEDGLINSEQAREKIIQRAKDKLANIKVI